MKAFIVLDEMVRESEVERRGERWFAPNMPMHSGFIMDDFGEELFEDAGEAWSRLHEQLYRELSRLSDRLDAVASIVADLDQAHQ